MARRNGSAIAIGHPRPATVRVLQQMLPSLPADIVLVKPSALLNEPQGNGGGYVPPPVKPQKPQPKNPFSGGIKQCKVKPPKEKTNAGTALGVIADSIATSPPVTFIKRHWQHWTQAKPQA